MSDRIFNQIQRGAGLTLCALVLGTFAVAAIPAFLYALAMIVALAWPLILVGVLFIALACTSWF